MHDLGRAPGSQPFLSSYLPLSSSLETAIPRHAVWRAPAGSKGKLSTSRLATSFPTPHTFESLPGVLRPLGTEGRSAWRTWLPSKSNSKSQPLKEEPNMFDYYTSLACADFEGSLPSPVSTSEASSISGLKEKQEFSMMEALIASPKHTLKSFEGAREQQATKSRRVLPFGAWTNPWPSAKKDWASDLRRWPFERALKGGRIGRQAEEGQLEGEQHLALCVCNDSELGRPSLPVLPSFHLRSHRQSCAHSSRRRQPRFLATAGYQQQGESHLARTCSESETHSAIIVFF